MNIFYFELKVFITKIILCNSFLESIYTCIHNMYPFFNITSFFLSINQSNVIVQGVSLPATYGGAGSTKGIASADTPFSRTPSS